MIAVDSSAAPSHQDVDGVNLSGGMTDANTQQHRKSIGIDEPSDHNPNHRYYVTTIREERSIRFEAGPFDTREQARAILPRVEEIAFQVNPSSVSYTFATFGFASDRYPKGELNHLLGLS